jgi:hypothetical protein
MTECLSLELSRSVSRCSIAVPTEPLAEIFAFEITRVLIVELQEPAKSVSMPDAPVAERVEFEIVRVSIAERSSSAHHLPIPRPSDLPGLTKRWQ